MTLIKFLNHLKPVQKCIGCKFWFVKGSKDVYATARCTRIVKSINCEKKYEYAYIARSDNEMCGPKGLNYEPIIRHLN